MDERLLYSCVICRQLDQLLRKQRARYINSEKQNQLASSQGQLQQKIKQLQFKLSNMDQKDKFIQSFESKFQQIQKKYQNSLKSIKLTNSKELQHYKNLYNNMVVNQKLTEKKNNELTHKIAKLQLQLYHCLTKNNIQQKIITQNNQINQMCDEEKVQSENKCRLVINQLKQTQKHRDFLFHQFEKLKKQFTQIQRQRDSLIKTKYNWMFEITQLQIKQNQYQSMDDQNAQVKIMSIISKYDNKIKQQKQNLQQFTKSIQSIFFPNETKIINIINKCQQFAQKKYKLQRNIQVLESDAKNLSQETIKLKQRNKVLQQNNHNLDSEVRSLKETINKLTQAQKKLSEKYERLQSNILSLTRQNFLKELINEFKNENLHNKTITLEKQLSSIKVLENKQMNFVDNLNKIIKNITNMFNAFKNSTNNTLTDYKKKNEILEKKNNQTSNQLEAKSRNVENLNSQKKKLEDTNGRLTAQLSTQQHKATNLQNENENLKTDIRNMTKKNDQLTKKNNQLTKKIQNEIKNNQNILRYLNENFVEPLSQTILKQPIMINFDEYDRSCLELLDDYKKSIFQIKYFPCSIIMSKYFNNQYTFMIKSLEQHQKKMVKQTQLIYKYDPITKKSPLSYISDTQNILIMLRLINGYGVGAFSNYSINEKQKPGNGFMFSLTLGEVFPMKSESRYSCTTFDQYYLIFGNSEIRIKEKQFFSNFGIRDSTFDQKNRKKTDILGENQKEKSQIQFDIFEVYQVKFDS